MDDGLLDANVFIHALTGDAFGAECGRFLALVRAGDIDAYLDPLVVHELTYTIGRVIRTMSTSDIVAYLLEVLSWTGIQGEKDVLREALDRWDRTPGLAFVDSYLTVRALRRTVPVSSKNVREFERQGVSTPNPLPQTQLG